MTDQEINNLLLDYEAAAAGAIPYIGGLIKVTILQFKTPEEVLGMEDFKEYVDDAIDAATVEIAVKTWQNALGTLMADLKDYQKNSQIAYSDKTFRWHYLLEKIEDADKINQGVLGKDGGEVEYDGIWRQSPYGVVETVGQLLLINVTIFDEIKTLVKLGQVPDGETGSSIQPVIKRVLAGFLAACKTMIPLSYKQRMSEIKVIVDSITMTNKTVSYGGYVQDDDIYAYHYQWADSSDSSAGINYSKTLTNPSDSARHAEETKIAKYRVEWLDYWFKIHQATVATLRSQITNVVDAFLSYDQETYEKEVTNRRSNGCVFGGATLHIEIDDAKSTDPAKGTHTAFDTVVYGCDNGGIKGGSYFYLPFFQYYPGGSTTDYTKVICWCFEKEWRDSAGHPQMLGFQSFYSYYSPTKQLYSAGPSQLSVFWNQATAYANGKLQTNAPGFKCTWMLPSLMSGKRSINWHVFLDGTFQIPGDSIGSTPPLDLSPNEVIVFRSAKEADNEIVFSVIYDRPGLTSVCRFYSAGQVTSEVYGPTAALDDSSTAGWKAYDYNKMAASIAG